VGESDASESNVRLIVRATERVIGETPRTSHARALPVAETALFTGINHLVAYVGVI
jgi:hypothetical protein